VVYKDPLKKLEYDKTRHAMLMSDPAYVAERRKYFRERYARKILDPEYKKKKDAQAAAWQAANYKKNYDRRRNSHYKRTYGITVDEYNAMFVDQGCVCGCCGSPVAGNKLGFMVDHNHTTNKVREIVCFPCNMALGCVKDQPTHLLLLLEYLERHECNSTL